MFVPGESTDSARFDAFISRFEEAWRLGERPDLGEYLGEAAKDANRRALIEGLVLIDLEWHWRVRDDEPPRLEDYLDRFPQLQEISPLSIAVIEDEYRARHNWGDRPDHNEYRERFQERWEELSRALELVDQELGRELRRQEPDVGEHLGRYKIIEQVGRGGFGLVFRARDDELSRDVAIKVPYRDRVATREDEEQFLAEARTIAGLDHPSVVPVYDLGTDNGVCYVVTKFVDGSELTPQIRANACSVQEIVEIVSSVADALHHAHLRGVTHRDVKPANILLDRAGKAYVTDFGLAVRDTDLRLELGVAGTPAYMSPEQARGEGHRVDGRTDIFSLGVVFYELLTGRNPFRGDSTREVLEMVKHVEPRPPRQLDDKIPRELERICLKALSKRLHDRYSTAADMAEDLRLWESTSVRPAGTWARTGAAMGDTPPGATTRVRVTRTDFPTPSSDMDGPSRPALHSDSQIVPKGLRSFDAEDADFFLDLLPGPRNRDGLPDSVRFWKTRIEATSSDQAFSVGMLYGPSGCGKSSLVKAGLLPRLAEHVRAAYIEATPQDTEDRLLAAIREWTPSIPPHASLADAISQIRTRHARPKLLLVIDQFEQWLHANPSPDQGELVDALRQCDGGSVQCLLLVRDDFWLSSCRFMDALEIELVPDKNVAIADLFDKLHAAKVLTRFGQAYGRLPDDSQITERQREFVESAVDGLARDDRLVCLRLALFADLVKGKPWGQETLTHYGGMRGLGVTFLEEVFGNQTAMPQHRLHERAARAVLTSLLPGYGTDIKGAMRSREELMAIAGLTAKPAEFDALVRVLDGDLRLITPTDVVEGERETESEPAGDSAGPASFYQLTHDYLVPSLREWLTRRQRETAVGRAELRLNERSLIWDNSPSSRNLPSLWEWANIRLLTAPGNWSQVERTMMSTASKFYGLRVGFLIVLAMLAGWVAYEFNGRSQANRMAQQLLVATFSEVPRIVDDLQPYRRWAQPMLQSRAAAAASSEDHAAQVRCSLALLSFDDSEVDRLVGFLRDAGPLEHAVICDALGEHEDRLAANPQALVDLVLDADAEEFQALLALWDQTRPVEPFLDFLASAPRSLWGQPGERAAPADEELQRTINDADGLLTDRFAFVQTLPLASGSGVITELAASGFRPFRFRPYDTQSGEFVAAAFLRDGRPWRMEMDQTQDELSELDEQNRRDGYLPVEISSRVDANGNEKHLGIWVQADDEESTKRVTTVAMAIRDHNVAATAWVRKKYRAITFHNYQLKDGSLRGSTVREYTNRPALGGAYPGAVYGDLYPGLLQTDIQLLHLPWDKVQRDGSAEKRYQERIAARPNDQRSWIKLAELKIVGGDVKEGLQDLETLFELDDRQILGYALRALALARLGDREAALKDLATYQGKTGSPLRRLAHAVRVHAALGDQAEAVEKLEAEIEGKEHGWPDTLDAAFAYATAARLVGADDEDLAKSYRSRAIQLLEQAYDVGLAQLSLRVRMDTREDPEFDEIRGMPELREMMRRRGFDHDYYATWFNRKNIESRTLYDLPIDEHLEACRRLAAEGFVIAGISAEDLELESGEWTAASVWHRPVATRDDAARENARRANAVIAAYRLGEAAPLWSALEHSENPDLRSFLVNRLRECGVGPEGLLDRLQIEENDSVRRALVLAMGEYDRSDFDEAFVRRLLDLYRDDGDAGMHGAAEWVLRRWGMEDEIGRLAEQPKEISPGRDWFINSQGQTFTVVRGPTAFQMGSPSYEANPVRGEMLEERLIPRSFAIATTETTVSLYQRFLDANPSRTSTRSLEYAPDDRCPIMEATWYRAAEYCNWLSRVEGLQPIYVPEEDGSFGSEMTFADNYLSLSGYRLPTRAEREYAARAGAATAWSFGDTPELHSFYGWYGKNSGERASPVGMLKPNDLGLFDVHGNALEWLQPAENVTVDGVEQDREARFNGYCYVCGGSWEKLPRDSRSAYARGAILASSPYRDGGFRICRTIVDE